MIRSKILFLIGTLVASSFLSVDTAEAGPLLDWLRGRQNTTNTGLFNRNNNTANFAGTVAPNAQGLQPGQCARTCNRTCSRTVVNYVPYTAYRSNWNRVPVTSYRPVTNTDPCTGCTVTCMRPCTTYTYQMQRVPYTTYRPVYRQETYQVPVTTITNDCATGGCSTGCNTCGTGVTAGSVPSTIVPPQGSGTTSFSQSTPSFATPQGSGTTVPQFETPSFPGAGSVPADATPSIPSLPSTGFGGGSTSRLNVPSSGTISTDSVYSSASRSSEPTVSIPRDLKRAASQRSTSQRSASATMVPIRRKFNYSTVRLASQKDSFTSLPVRAASRKSTASNSRRSIQEINSLWKDVN